MIFRANMTPGVMHGSDNKASGRCEFRRGDVLDDLNAVVQFIITEAQAPSAELRAAPPPEGEE